MSKSGGPHEAVTKAIAAESGKPPSRLQVVILWLTAMSLFWVVMTPVTYFIGRAFHDGWYEALHLDPGMFPLDTASMLIQGFVAEGEALAKLAGGISQVLVTHGVLLLALLAIGALTWGAIMWLGHWADDRRARQPKKSAKPDGTQRRSLGSLIFTAVLMLLLFAFSFYELVFGLTLGYALVTLPFYKLGQYEANQLASTDFVKKPTVTVKTQTGDMQLRELGCGPIFCALWANKHASFAPSSTITWGDGSVPDR